MEAGRIYTPHADYMTTAAAARELGVSADLVRGLLTNGQLDGIRQRNSRGNWVSVVRRDAVAALRKRMAEM